MKYVCLIYADAAAAAAHERAHRSHLRRLRAGGLLAMAAVLQPSSAAPAGPPLPWGFFTVHARDFNAAVRIAGDDPMAACGAVEVRPTVPCGGLDDLERAMKYLCLVYLPEDRLNAVPDRVCKSYGDELRASGRYVAAEALQPVHTATTLRVRNGQLSMTDGPFAETKEHLAGFYLIDAENLDEAIAWAARIPPATEGSIEVRPVRQLQP